ncbi:hypothetical protein [Actinomadura luteofluorescens]|uniref:hypothetical protein n=1 Tax=Actinomadura luteofluorescens TaxID=46163 RepID=UPI003D9190C6
MNEHRVRRAVVAIGDLPSTGHVPAQPAERLTVPSALTGTADAYERVAAHLADFAEILVVYPEWDAAPARRLLPVVRGLLDTDRVAELGLRLPPLAFSLVADLLAHSARYMPLGLLARVSERLEREVAAGARMGSVTRLANVPAGLRQHVRSYVPGSGFVAWAAPVPRVDAVNRRTGTLDPPEPVPDGQVHLLVARRDGEFPGLRDRLVEAFRPDKVLDVAPQPLGARYWGTRRHAEFVAFSTAPSAFRALVQGERFWHCPWCRRPTASEICPSCRMFQTDPPHQNQSWPPAPPDPAPGREAAPAARDGAAVPLGDSATPILTSAVRTTVRTPIALPPAGTAAAHSSGAPDDPARSA